jgi:hypothetical protein
MNKNEPIDFESLRPPKPTTINYNKKGAEASVSETPLAKKIEHVSGKIVYLISQYRGLLFDPWGPYLNKTNSCSLKKTSEKAFHLYLRYLKTRDRASLILAERSHSNA